MLNLNKCALKKMGKDVLILIYCFLGILSVFPICVGIGKLWGNTSLEGMFVGGFLTLMIPIFIALCLLSWYFFANERCEIEIRNKK